MEGVNVHVSNILYEQFTRTIPAHRHGSGCYEIHCIPFGYGKVKADGIEYEISPGTLYVTGPDVEHAQTPLLSDPMREYCIYFKLRKSSRSRTPSPIMDIFTATPFWLGRDSQGVCELMQRLFSELEHRYTGYREQVELMLAQLIIALARSYEQHPEIPVPDIRSDSPDNKSRIIEEYFLYEYSSLSLNTLAERLALSPRQTQRLLLEYYNKSFQEKKAEARMSAAALLLGDKRRSIASIAEALGYSSPEHFSNAFRKYYQLSPSVYRRRLP